jgi:hypothetical protein
MKHLTITSFLLVAACATTPSPTADRTRHVPVVERGLAYSNGLPAQNGVQSFNGLALSNGLAYSNGLMYSNGLAEVDGFELTHRDLGLDVDHALSSEQGLSTQYGYVTHSVGRQFVKYLAECALGPNDRVTKGQHTFMGRLGLAPEWKTGQCDDRCQTWVTACLLARTNAQGATVDIELRATHPAIGLGVADPAFSAHEGAFFGNVFADYPSAYTCQGMGLPQAVARNRLCADGQCAGITVTDYRLCASACTFENGSVTRCPASSWAGAVPFPVISVWTKP